MSKSVIISEPKSCDVCAADGVDKQADYDARLTKGLYAGRWANLCTPHWSELTDRQLGTGYGQRLLVGVSLKKES